MLTARTFAKEKGISYTTVMAWLRDGLIPGAEQQETPIGMVWQIPQSSLDLVERQKPGPKPKAEDDPAKLDGANAQIKKLPPQKRPRKKQALSGKKKTGKKAR